MGGLIVLGGPMGVYESDTHPFLQAETALIEKMIAAGRPALGICLGAQLIAQVLGARVFPGEQREVGWAPVELTEDGQRRSAVRRPRRHAHRVPSPRRHLRAAARRRASRALGRYEQQAFRWGDIVYGFQFHLEFTEAIISRLVNDPELHRYLIEAGGDPKELLAKTAGHVSELADVAHEVFGRYFGQCGLSRAPTRSCWWRRTAAGVTTTGARGAVRPSR